MHTRTYPADYVRNIPIVDHPITLCKDCGGWMVPAILTETMTCLDCGGVDGFVCMCSEAADWREQFALRDRIVEACASATLRNFDLLAASVKCEDRREFDPVAYRLYVDPRTPDQQEQDLFAADVEETRRGDYPR